ncbi:MAG: polymer-forming cytoskeletal protein [Anaerolineae bacterium]|nr:polymer-forming cytoskeletal protein [Anaerolineae bacterium]
MIFGSKEQKAKPQAAKSPRPAVEIETIVGPNTSLKGDICSSGGVRVEGDFSGTIEIAGNLIIGEHAKIVATISANNVQVQGNVQGDVTAKRLEILDTGRLWGNISVDSFVLDDGGFFRGQSKMQSDIEPPLLEAPRSAVPDDIVDVQPTFSTEK